MKQTNKQLSEPFVLTGKEQEILEYHKTLKLQIELIPKTCWFKNVRSNVEGNQWDKIRKDTYTKALSVCEICGDKGTKHPVECHEVWIYEESTLIQRLNSFQAICPLCHEVKHIGHAGLKGNGERAFNRFIAINNLDEIIARKIKSAVYKQWGIRSNLNWKLDIGLLKTYDIDTGLLEVKTDSSNKSAFPSKIMDSYWVVATSEICNNHYRKFKNKENPGKWLVFADITEIDSLWQKIKKATQEGLLGVAAKAATAKPNPNASSPDEKVVCVYTYNWLDKEDVFRVEKTLRSIGIHQNLYYKADSDTAEGNYKNRGDHNISKYISKGEKSYRKFTLGTINSVGYEKKKILNRLGIKNFNDLLLFDTSKKLAGVGASSEYINKLKHLALSHLENKIFRLSPFPFPQKDILHFDIETDINTPHENTRVWSIAIHHNKKVTHFYAETWKQEKKILSEFLKYLRTCEDTAMYSYSGFDISVLKHALKRHKLDVDFFLSRSHYDLCAILKQNYIFPLKSYSVKEIGGFLGYKYKDQDFDGLMAATEYINCQNSGTRISKELFQYIQDDVKVMHHIVEKIVRRKDIKDIFDHS